MLLGDNGLFYGICATNGRTIAFGLCMQIPGAHTLEPGDFLRLFVIRKSDKMSLKRTGCRKNSFKFHAGYYIGMSAVSIDITSGWIEGRKAMRKYYRSHFDGKFFCLIIKINCTGRTKFLAGFTSPFFEVNTTFVINGILKGDRLGILKIYCLPFSKTCIIFIIHFFRTFFGT